MLTKSLVRPSVVAYPTREGSFVLPTDASDLGMGAMLEQDQEENGWVVKRIISYVSKMLNASQGHYCPTKKELLAVVTAVELSKVLPYR